MTTMDLNLARMPSTADAGAVQPAAGKGGEAADAETGGEFGTALKAVARDRQGKGQAASGQSSQKPAIPGKPKDALLERLRQIEAQQRAPDDGSEIRLHLKIDALEDTETASDEEPADGLERAPDTPSDAAGLGTSGAEKALALLLSPGTEQDGKAPQTDADEPTQKAATVPPGAMTGSEEAKPVREVKIVSVKVETHFAPIGTSAVAAGLAEKIANAGPAGAAAKSQQDARASEGTQPGAGQGADRLASLKDLEIAQPGAAGGDRRGGDASGRGADARPDAKTPAAGAERKVASGTVEAPATAPGQGVAPIEQIGHRIASVAHELKSESAAPVAQTSSDASPGSGPVRVLSINLHPEDLGSVTVRMSLVRDALEVQIDAELPATQRMLQSDSDALSDMLRSAGIQVEGVTVRAAAPDTVSAGTGSSQTMADGQSQGGAGADARAGSGRQDRQQELGERASGRRGYEDDTSQRGAAGGLYV
ncbi:MAG: flagellar hook-length control protein FliK [Hyphomicrobiaceae bacterium]|nr:flagellar hook-length control protein FliK [Hyphomicrobiaceae bacterium]